jgi:serine/threonine-protein kinase
MSPEQASGNKTVDHHTDIWSAGTIFYEMLLGRVPYEGSTYNIVISQLLTKDFPAPREIEPLIPPEVEAVVLKAMAREPEDRYGSADEFLAEVRRLRAAVKDLRLEPPPAEQSFESFQGPPVNSEAPTVRTDPLAPTAAMKPESGAVGSADTLAATTRGASKTVMKSRPVALLVIAMLGVVFLGVLIGFGIVLLNLSSRAEERPEAVAVGRVAPPGPSEAPTRPPSEVEPASAPATPSLEATADDEPRVQAASAAEPPSSAPASPVPQPEEPADPEPREAPQGPEPPSSKPPVPVFARPEAPSTPRGAQGSARPEPEPLSQAEIRQGLSRLDAQVRRCLARGGRPPERLTVRVVVDGAGRASYLGASPRPWASANLCLRQVFSGARFRATGAEPVSVTHTYRGNGLMSSPFAQ